MDWTDSELNDIVSKHSIVLFMKGTPESPQCGFSSRAANVLQSFGEEFVSLNVLSQPKAIPAVCQWSDFPTMPQVFINGELIGGSDIVLEMLQSGELREMYDSNKED